MVWNLLILVGNQAINGGIKLKSLNVSINRIEMSFTSLYYDNQFSKQAVSSLYFKIVLFFRLLQVVVALLCSNVNCSSITGKHHSRIAFLFFFSTPSIHTIYSTVSA